MHNVGVSRAAHITAGDLAAWKTALRRWRVEEGLTVVELAERMGLSERACKYALAETDAGVSLRTLRDGLRVMGLRAEVLVEGLADCRSAVARGGRRRGSRADAASAIPHSAQSSGKERLTPQDGDL